MSKLLEVKNLKVVFHTKSGDVPAVDHVNFHVNEGETLCIVGESGCGKSATIQSIMKLLPVPPAEYMYGKILFNGTDLIPYSNNEMTEIRGKDISMIFQEPMTALNPVQTIEQQIGEVFEIHQHMTKKERFEHVVKNLELVGIADPIRCAKSFPHQLSGGMRQRAMIAMALACKPKLLLADEPTTALDVTIQAQILDLIRKLKEKTNMTVVLITHDLGVVAEMAERVIVMYSGQIIEESPVKDLFKEPLHPYTLGLISCIPKIDSTEKDLYVIEGQVSNPLNFPKGCRFHPRCPYSKDICKEQQPVLKTIGQRKVACHFTPDERISN